MGREERLPSRREALTRSGGGATPRGACACMSPSGPAAASTDPWRDNSGRPLALLSPVRPDLGGDLTHHAQLRLLLGVGHGVGVLPRCEAALRAERQAFQ